jgi:probable HAF family extracellular repeat protein
LIDLGTLGGTNSNATAVNSLGWVAGSSQVTGNSAQRAFVWRLDTGAMTDLGTLGGNNSTARGVNTAGMVVGNSDAVGGVQRPFLWTPGGGMIDIGGLGGSSATGFAFGINDVGTIVGHSERIDGTFGAYLLQGGTMTDLGTLGGENSTAFAINNAGVIVGQADDVAGDKRATVWDPVNGLRDINSLLTIPIPGFTLTRAFGINDNGDILAVSERQDGTTVFLISGDPNPFTMSVIPAPAAGVLFAMVMPVFLWRQRKRRTCETGDQSKA